MNGIIKEFEEISRKTMLSLLKELQRLNDAVEALKAKDMPDFLTVEEAAGVLKCPGNSPIFDGVR